MRTIQEFLIIYIWPLAARISTAAAGSHSFPLIAIALVIAVAIIKTAHRWMHDNDARAFDSREVTQSSIQDLRRFARDTLNVFR